MLAALFGPEWAAHQQRDSQGRIFLNCSPYCFARILSFLRCKLIEDPEQPALPPVVQADSQAEFAALVQYFGLQDFMGIKQSSVAEYHFNRAINMQLADGGHSAEATDRHGYAMAAPAMASGQHFFKCRIDKAGPCHWIFLGVTGHSELNDVEDHRMTFGWTPFAHYAAGEFVPGRSPSIPGPIELPQWGAGHELMFRVVLNGQAGALYMACLHMVCIFELKLHFPVASNLSFVVGAAMGTSVHISSATIQDWHQVDSLPTYHSSTLAASET